MRSTYWRFKCLLFSNSLLINFDFISFRSTTTGLNVEPWSLMLFTKNLSSLQCQHLLFLMALCISKPGKIEVSISFHIINFAEKLQQIDSIVTLHSLVCTKRNQLKLWKALYKKTLVIWNFTIWGTRRKLKIQTKLISCYSSFLFVPGCESGNKGNNWFFFVWTRECSIPNYEKDNVFYLLWTKWSNAIQPCMFGMDIVAIMVTDNIITARVSKRAKI